MWENVGTKAIITIDYFLNSMFSNKIVNALKLTWKYF